jgi:hypothetical protein
MARPVEKESSMSHRNKTSSRPLCSSEEFIIRDDRPNEKRDRRRPSIQTLEVAPSRFVDITYDPLTGYFDALGFQATSRLDLLDAILGDWLQTQTVREVLGGTWEPHQSESADIAEAA